MKIIEFCAKLNIGGAQTVAANIARYADSSMSFCYVVFGDEIGEYEDELKELGHKIIHMNGPRNNVLQFIKQSIEIMKTEQANVVHAHTMYSCGLIMLAAKVAKVPGRISHSHTTDDDTCNNLIRKLYKLLMRSLIIICGTDFCACGVDAGNTLYGKKWFSKNGEVIRNGIDIHKFEFNLENRDKIRTELGIQNKLVVGHIGHYVKVKNQGFLIRIINQMIASRPNTVLLLYGEGPERESLSKTIEDYGVEEQVKLMGNVNNIAEVLSAIDVFVFPSLYEGTPLALIEAQVNGLPCIISDTIPEDACLTNNIFKLGLDCSINEWIRTINSVERMDGREAYEDIRYKYGTIEETMENLYDIFRKYRGIGLDS